MGTKIELPDKEIFAKDYCGMKLCCLVTDFKKVEPT